MGPQALGDFLLGVGVGEHVFDAPEAGGSGPGEAIEEGMLGKEKAQIGGKFQHKGGKRKGGEGESLSIIGPPSYL